MFCYKFVKLYTTIMLSNKSSLVAPMVLGLKAYNLRLSLLIVCTKADPSSDELVMANFAILNIVLPPNYL